MCVIDRASKRRSLKSLQVSKNVCANEWDFKLVHAANSVTQPLPPQDKLFMACICCLSLCLESLPYRCCIYTRESDWVRLFMYIFFYFPFRALVGYIMCGICVHANMRNAVNIHSHSHFVSLYLRWVLICIRMSIFFSHIKIY